MQDNIVVEIIFFHYTGLTLTQWNFLIIALCHINVSVDEEPEQMNDLDAPPPVPKRFDSLTAIEETTKTETSNLQEFNIKPDQPEKLQSAISGDETEYILLYSRTRESGPPGSIIEAGNDLGETHMKQIYCLMVFMTS